MVRLLQIETATSVCSTALSEDGKTAAASVSHDGFKHSENLMVLVQKTLDKAGWKYGDLDAVVVSTGPGSYTGLRIGVSSAKGLCYALDKPLIAISTLEVLSIGFIRENEGFDGLLCPMIDARRMEVYTALFDKEGKRVTSDRPMIIEDGAFAEELRNNRIAFFGDGAEKCKELIGESGNAFFGFNSELSADDMSEIGFNKFRKNEFVDLAYFEPEYLKPYAGTPPKGLV